MSGPTCCPSTCPSAGAPVYPAPYLSPVARVIPVPAALSRSIRAERKGPSFGQTCTVERSKRRSRQQVTTWNTLAIDALHALGTPSLISTIPRNSLQRKLGHDLRSGQHVTSRTVDQIRRKSQSCPTTHGVGPLKPTSTRWGFVELVFGVRPLGWCR